MSVKNPFHPFTPYDREQLGEPIGRDAETVTVQSLLQPPYRLCIVTGDIGIGKSTFLRYSLTNELQDEKTDIVILTATSSDTVDSIVDSVFSHLDYKSTQTKQEVGEISDSEQVNISQAIAVVKPAQKDSFQSIFELYNLVRQYEDDTGRTIILMYDQLEHLLMAANLDNRLTLLQSLLNLSALPHISSKMIFAVRDKFLNEIFRLTSSYPWITSRILYLHGLKQEEAKEYIRTSTKRAGITFSAKLIDKIIEKLLDFENYTSPIALNAVCYSLASFAIDKNKRAGIKHLSDIGGFPGVIGKAIADSLQPLPNEMISDLI